MGPHLSGTLLTLPRNVEQFISHADETGRDALLGRPFGRLHKRGEGRSWDFLARQCRVPGVVLRRTRMLPSDGGSHRRNG